MGKHQKKKNKGKKNGSKANFEKKKPKVLKKDIRMMSGCEDKQTSADVSDVKKFKLPDPAGKGGGACTSTLLGLLYKDHKNKKNDLSFTEVLTEMRKSLKKGGFSQIPQLSSAQEINVNDTFDITPKKCKGKKLAVMIGINYVNQKGELKGCQNDVLNMKDYIMDCHGFKAKDITLLLDKKGHTQPTKKNILAAYKKVIKQAKKGDCIYLHYSGHGIKIKDKDGDEEDGFDEALAPSDYAKSGLIKDDDLYDLIVVGLKNGVSLFSLMDCCHSGSILDLPYVFKPNGTRAMELDEDLDLDAFCDTMAEFEDHDVDLDDDEFESEDEEDEDYDDDEEGEEDEDDEGVDLSDEAGASSGKGGSATGTITTTTTVTSTGKHGSTTTTTTVTKTGK